MNTAIKGIKLVINVVITIMLFGIIFIYLSSAINGKINFFGDGRRGIGGANSSGNLKETQDISPFSFKDNSIIYSPKAGAGLANAQAENQGISDVTRSEILSRAKAMTEVKWTPKYNLLDKKSSYTFVKGKVYVGVPYSMDLCQVKSPTDFLGKISNSKILYGNDCSGFVSAAWGVDRQTTLSFYNAMKNSTKISGQNLCEISWNDLKPGDALLLENGTGKGHIMLYVGTDKKNTDNINVYEQNIATKVPYQPIPVARSDVRSKSNLLKNGYTPIRLMEKI